MTMIPTPNQQKQFQSTEYQTILYILPEYSTNLQQIKKTIHGDTELKKKKQWCRSMMMERTASGVN